MTRELAVPQEEAGPAGLIASLPAILWQRRWLVLIPFVLLSAAGIAAAFLLPREYVSRATLLVVSQNIVVEGGGQVTEVVDRRIARIRQQLLSRPDLVELIQANDLYRASRRAEPLSALVERMREATSLTAVDADIGRGGGAGNPSSIAFALSFTYPEAAQAQIVTQAFVDRLLRLDASETQNQAEENVRFLEDQQGTLQGQVSAIEGQINRITGQEGMALANAGGTAFMMSSGSQYDTQIATLQKENNQLSSQIGSGSVERDPNVVAATGQLAGVKAVYADDHPDVKLAETRLAAARKLAAATKTGAVDDSIRRQMAINNQMIAQINQARSNEQGRAQAVMSAQARGPVIAQQVGQLQSRAESLRTNLARINSGLVNAQSVARLANEQRGERLTLVDPPVTPDKPTSPNRFMLIAGGIAGGLAAGLGLALLLELVMQPIRSVSTLTGLVGAPPLGVVPDIRRLRGRRPRRSRRRFALPRLWPSRRRAKDAA